MQIPTVAKYVKMAERPGFEPGVGFLALHSLSRRAPSAVSGISPR